MERILAAADEYLVAHGVTGFTTNVVADRAGVNIATLYSYFPDKVAILRELLERADEERSEALSECLDELADEGWREALSDGIDTMARYRVTHPGTPVVRQAALMSPQLRELDRETHRRLAARMAARIRQRNPDLTAREADRICQVAVVSSMSVLDDACDNGRVDRRKVAELKEMMTGYLAPYLGA